MRTGCYVLDLYCDSDADHGHRPFPVQFTAEDGGTCRKMARKAGWKLGRMNAPDRFDLCPKCAGAREPRITRPYS